MAASTKTSKKDAPAKVEAPAVDHTAVIAAVTSGIFDATVAKKSHTRCELDGKQVVYAERRKSGACFVMPARLVTDTSIQSLVTAQEWHGGRATIVVSDSKSSIATGRKVVKHVVDNYRAGLKAAEAAEAAKVAEKEAEKASKAAEREAKKAATAAERAEKQAAERAVKQAQKAAAKAEAEAAAAASGDDVE